MCEFFCHLLIDNARDIRLRGALQGNFGLVGLDVRAVEVNRDYISHTAEARTNSNHVDLIAH